MVAEYSYHSTKSTENFSLIACLQMKLCLVKVGKLDACIRPLFANSVTYTMLTGLKINDQVLKAYIYVAIALCSIKFYSYAVVDYHGWHLNDINGSLM